MSETKIYWESTADHLLEETRQALNEYLLSLKLANKAEATIGKYRKIIEAYFKQCTVQLDEMTSDHVLTWLTTMSEGKKTGTIDVYLSAVSSFFSFCLDEEYMSKTVVKKRWRPKIPNSLPKYLDEFEYARVKVSSEQLPIRDRALLLFLFSTGCRVSEVVSLRVQDIDFDKRKVDVMGKGSKIRQIYFSEECGLVLQDYLDQRLTKPDEPLFMNKFGKGLQAQGIRGVLRKVGVKAGLLQSFHPHMCRHTFATNMLARGADLHFIADVLGHTDLNTTRIYAQIPTEDMLLIYQNIMG